MANVNAPFGLRPVAHLQGSTWPPQARRYYIPQADTLDYYIGDCVISKADCDLLNGAPACQLATHSGSRNAALTTGDLAIRGVIVGFGSQLSTGQGNMAVDSDPRNQNILYVPATKTYAYYVYVIDDPYVIYEAQVDTIANTAFNKNCPLFVASAPTAPANQSASYAQASAANVGAGYPLRIIGAPHRIDNSLASPGTYAKVFVMINMHELSGATVGI